MGTIKNVLGFLKSIYLLLFWSIKRPCKFTGYCQLWFARQYRAKRELFWSRQWDQLGKWQYILPFSKGTLIVCSKLELKNYQKIGLINPNINVKLLMKRSF
jgi:hypothetical protein